MDGEVEYELEAVGPCGEKAEPLRTAGLEEYISWNGCLDAGGCGWSAGTPCGRQRAFLLVGIEDEARCTVWRRSGQCFLYGFAGSVGRGRV